MLRKKRTKKLNKQINAALGDDLDCDESDLLEWFAYWLALLASCSGAQEQQRAELQCFLQKLGTAARALLADPELHSINGPTPLSKLLDEQA
jgi:hypothetical protein